GDFGLSRFVPQATRNSSPDQTYSIGVRGSIGYTAPEYGMGSSVSTQGDVYSYGILLLEMFTGRRPTNETFAEGVSLRTFVEMTWPERVLEIADPTLVEHLDDDRFGRQKTEECLVSILGIGIACSLETPRKRLDMGDVLNELRLIQNSLLSTEFNSRER
ncbi:non-specific serine,threonine protein kinase, partial [Sarracenia purpurea var. burkii]